MPTHLILVFILVTVAAVAIAANRTKIPSAILLVIVGLVVSVTPGLPRVELSPELVLLLVVPPLVYSAGVAMSWREFRYDIRTISLLAFGGVTFTTVAVAAVVHYLLRWDWSVGFVLGAIISPPDEVAPLAIARRLGLPRRTMVVIEGEGLANDATALILYRFAVAAVALARFRSARPCSSSSRLSPARSHSGWRSDLRACGCADGLGTRVSRSSCRCSRRSPPIGPRKRWAAPASSPPWCAASTSVGTGRCSFPATPACRGYSSGTSSSICWRAGCSS
jgi:hypothetical protein